MSYFHFPVVILLGRTLSHARREAFGTSVLPLMCLEVAFIAPPSVSCVLRETIKPFPTVDAT